MALTKDQFAELYHQGLTPEQIAKFEGGETPDTMVTVRQHARTRPPSRGAHTLAQGVGGAIGGTLGGLVGQPTLGAGIGGAGAEALAQQNELGIPVGYGGPPIITDPGAILNAGGTQAAFEYGGRQLGSMAGRVLSPASRKVAAFLAAKTENIVRAADQSGIVINATKAADEALAPFMRQAKAAGTDAVKALEKFRNNFLGTGADAAEGQLGFSTTAGQTDKIMAPSDAHLAKEYFDSLSRGVRDAKGGGSYVGPAEKLVGQYSQALAAKLKQQLVRNVPKYGEALGQEALNLRRRALLTAAARPIAGGAAALAVHETPGLKNLPWYVKYGVVPVAAGYAANPAVLSQLAEIASNPALQALLGGTASNAARAVQSSQ